MATANHISKIAIVGSSGNVGRYMTEALLKTGRHTVTAITRPETKGTFPQGVVVKEVDYSKPETLVEALRGQEALVITISGHAPIREIEEKLIRAAGEAGVPWILPNEWSPDSAHEGIVNDVFIFKSKVAARKLIEEIGKSSYIAVATGFWYEYSLSIPSNYGFNFANRTVRFYDDGEIKISTSTWPQVGRAVAGLLSLPITPEGPNTEACLESLRNKVVYVNSFTINQKDMLASVLRQTETKEEDWTITKVPAQELHSTSSKQIAEGKKDAYASYLYSRIFFPDGSGDFEHKGTLNSMLNLPKEDIDEATNNAIKRQLGLQEKEINETTNVTMKRQMAQATEGH
ncbi:hypothetical protein F5884DRAFT_751303 [Xylogone sp. PMI_703]|nr:hypothetical protein F5884DRAFT_751303 [Xylogone sp. PMI_703]